MRVASLEILDHNSLYSILKQTIKFYHIGQVTVEEFFQGPRQDNSLTHLQQQNTKITNYPHL